MIQKAVFGSHMNKSSRVIFGGASLSDGDEERAEQAFQLLRRYGVNHIDTSVSYGSADIRIGEWMASHRDEFFLAGKIDARSYPEARRELELSLKNLQTDHFDLLQMHELVRDEDVDAFLSKDGAVEVLSEAKEKGYARFIGVTGHGFEAPRLLRQCLEALPVDSVLLPYNYLLSKNNEYRAAFEELRQICRSRLIAVQTIKSLMRSPWDDRERTRSTWYRPLEDQEEIDRAVWWLLGHEDLFLCSAGDVDLLPKVLDAAERFSSPPEDGEMEKMRKRLGMQLPEQRGWPRMS